MELPGRNQRSTGDITQSHVGVSIATGHYAAVGAEHHTGDVCRMSLQVVQQLSGVHVPQPYRLVIAARGQAFAAGTEDHASDEA